MRYLLIFIVVMIQQPGFKQKQLSHVRVKTAYSEKEAVIRKYFSDKKLSYDNFNLFLRAFKKEKRLEVWVSDQQKKNYTLLHTYEICANSGTFGPKRKEGDLQVPEGVYHINHFNPQSNFFLSLGISYPNTSDRILSDKKSPGSAIYIHGNCVTIGCIPITDEYIKELYVLAVEATDNGQQKIPIHIFPCMLTDEKLAQLKREMPEHSLFWENLKPVYDNFENTKTLKEVSVDARGLYSLL